MAEQGGSGERGQWGSRLGFILAAAGSAVGLGNIWKFPYITGENGGGFFVLIYLVCIALVGLPIMSAEILVGRAAQRSPVQAYQALSGDKVAWSIVGWMGVLTGFVILSYYSVVAGWAIEYVRLAVGDSFASAFASGADPAATSEAIGGVFSALYGDFETNLLWHAVFMVVTVGIVLGGVQKGIETGARILMPTLFAIMLGLLLYGATTDGFGQGVDFVFGLHADKLTPGGVLEALGHSFFSLSLGMGALITYGSYLRRDDDMVAASGAISLLDTIVALMACMIMFPLVFSVGGTPSAGPGLVFVSMPIAFGQMPGGYFIGIAFFVLLVFAALTSAISLLEVVVATIIDKFGVARTKATAIVGLVIFCFGVPSAKSDLMVPGLEWNFFDTMDKLASNILLPLGGLLIAIFVGWVMPAERVREEFMAGSRWGSLFAPWFFLVRFVAPVAIGLVFLHALGLL
ncbi:sodium-dependent transporter [Haliangium ochraceum]|uniref:Transporter n=1 Tax=Haliangium ochraceum (strain DSM 14365 / JCM 11303 / SMP-2) TaxID=502025 RepID=D0LKS6_HALO1|nr:sodium-dependent transporter [Haliangium ochraceum]ACY16646.1 sodium:neurotransmitter symporter [Haliangium ochraceum DSM 14365]